MGREKRVCVIGSNSFSGNDFIDLLLETGRFSVLGVSRSSLKSPLFLSKKIRSSDKYFFSQIDLNKDLEKLFPLLDDFHPEYIVNFAAQSEVGPSWSFPEQWYQTNVIAMTKLAETLKEKKYLKKYVHISSPEVYGSCSGVVKEDFPYNPSTPYAASKAAGDLSLSTYWKNFSFPLVTIRSTNVYGARQQLFKIIPRSIVRLKSNRLINLHGGGRAIKSYIHIRDISRGELAIMENGRVGEVYHLSPREGYSVRDIVKNICDILKSNFSSSVCEVEERQGQDSAYVIDSEKSRKEFAWESRISIEDGICDVVKWIEDNWEAILKEPLEYVHKP